MSGIGTVLAVAILGAVVIVLRAAVAVLRAEAPWWGPRLLDQLLRLISRLLPEDERRVRRDEWLGEVDAIRHRDRVPGVLFTLEAAVAAGRLRAAAARRRRAAKRRSGVIRNLPQAVGGVVVDQGEPAVELRLHMTKVSEHVYLSDRMDVRNP